MHNNLSRMMYINFFFTIGSIFFSLKLHCFHGIRAMVQTTYVDHTRISTLITTQIKEVMFGSQLRICFPTQNISILPNILIKLDEPNYLIQQEKLNHMINVYGLQHFIVASVLTPPWFLKKIVQVSIGEIFQNQEFLENNPEY